MATEAPMQVDAAASLPELLASSRAAMSAASTTIARQRWQHEAELLRFQRALAALRAENERLRSGEPCVAASDAPAAEAPAAAALAQSQAEADAQLAALRRQLDKSALELAGAHEALAASRRREAEHAAQISALQKRNTELLELRVDAQKRLDEQDATALRLARDAQERTAESSVARKRVEFLESERARQASELVELRSQLQVNASEHAAALKAQAKKQAEVRAEASKERQCGEALERQVALLKDELVKLQKQREKERADAIEETKNLGELVAMHKEEAADAERQALRYKELLDTVAVDKMELANGRGAQMKVLDAHAEALLKDLQATLDEKLEHLERQSKMVEEAHDAERRMAISFETQVRESEELTRKLQQLMAQQDVAQRENEQLRSKVNRLEERILVAGGLVNTPRSEIFADNHDMLD